MFENEKGTLSQIRCAGSNPILVNIPSPLLLIYFTKDRNTQTLSSFDVVVLEVPSRRSKASNRACLGSVGVALREAVPRGRPPLVGKDDTSQRDVVDPA